MVDDPIPVFVRLAAHPVRWRLLTELAAGDHRVRELTDLVGQPQNLVSYHLRLLRDGGLVTSRRSSFDGRDSYYHLDLDRCAHALAAAGTAVHPALRTDRSPPPAAAGAGHLRPRVLFACTGNSTRSPIAEALLRHHSGGHAQVTSAGSRPAPRLHPHTVRVLRERYGIDVTDGRPRHLGEVTGHGFDCVISLCDRVREVLPEFPHRPRRIHWSIPEPAAGTGDPDGYAAVERTAAEIDTRVRHLLMTLTRTPTEEVAP